MLAVLLAMISLPDLDPEPIKTPAATVGQRLTGNSGSAIEGLLDGPAAVGDVQFTATCGFGVMPLMGAAVGDMSALSPNLATPACVPPQNRFAGLFATPLGYGLPTAYGAFGTLTPVALPVFGVRTPFAPTPLVSSPGFAALGGAAPSPAWATVHRGMETGAAPAPWHRALESAVPGSAAMRVLPRPAPARVGR